MILISASVAETGLMATPCLRRNHVTRPVWLAMNMSLFCCCCSVSHVWLFVTPWTAACQTFLFFTISWSLLKLVPIESLMPSNHLILYHPLVLLPSIFLSIRVFTSESALHIKWQEYWSFSFSTSPSSEYSGLISFRSLLQVETQKKQRSILQLSFLLLGHSRRTHEGMTEMPEQPWLSSYSMWTNAWEGHPAHSGLLEWETDLCDTKSLWLGGCFSLQYTAKSLQSCPTLCNPIPGILQARTLEWVAISFSNV